MSIYEKLLKIQCELKAPKRQYNSYSKFNYRSCEDILEAVKPLLKENNCVLVLTDDVVEKGNMTTSTNINKDTMQVNIINRVYIKATATLTDGETGEQVSNSAFAREAETKKGMDDSQITGTASSYARKYALNGLFCIDDTKDADTDEYGATTNNNTQKAKTKATGTNTQQKQPFITGDIPQKTKILGGDGQYYALTRFTVPQLQSLLSNPAYAEIRIDIETVIRSMAAK